MEDVVFSAPGKVILTGEHAVVHGKLSLAFSLGLRSFLRLTLFPEAGAGSDLIAAPSSSPSHQVRLLLPNLGRTFSWETTELRPLLALFPPGRGAEGEGGGGPPSPTQMAALQALLGSGGDHGDDCSAATAFLFLYLSMATASQAGRGSGATPPLLPGLVVRAWSQLPIGSGLGSSAAFCVSAAAALLATFRLISPPTQGHSWRAEDLERVNCWAFRGEEVVHGSPSGVDNAVATWGGALRFQSGKISPLKKVPTLRILLTDTKVPRSTKDLVAGVRRRLLKFPAVVGPVLSAIHAVSEECERILEKMADREKEEEEDEHYAQLEELIDVSQGLLCALGVGHPALETVARATAARGLHSKLTGAGGGGCALTLLRPTAEAELVSSVMAALSSSGFGCFPASLGGPGLCAHSPSSLEKGVWEALNAD